MKLESVVITRHAREQMDRRGISEAQVHRVLAIQEEIFPVRAGRVVVQGIVSVGEKPLDYLLRVFVDTDRTPAEVVTAYRTSKIDKYRRKP